MMGNFHIEKLRAKKRDFEPPLTVGFHVNDYQLSPPPFLLYPRDDSLFR